MRRRAIGIIRVSQVAGREGESFASPGEQRDRIEAACQRDQLDLLRVVDELDVSGGTPLYNRDGLRQAIEAVEAGEADVIVAAYFDRLVRSLTVQGELVSRVEQAGGEVLALDIGAVSSNTAGQWLSGTMLGAVSEYQRRTSAERTKEAQARAVARGVAPWPRVPLGYRRREDRVLEPDPNIAPVVAEAFALRASGATTNQVRDFLAANGLHRSYHGVGSLLKSRVYLGEIHFGKLSNLTAHEPIVDRDTWVQAQRAKSIPGRRAKSARLLARLGVLRCGTCDARMVVGTANHSRYRIYRCPPNGECERRVTIGAEIAEGVVVAAVRTAIAGMEGHASADAKAREAEAQLHVAQGALEGAIRAFSGLEDEASVVERLSELRTRRDQAAERVAHLRGLADVIVVRAVEDWDALSLEARRAIIRATVKRVAVQPGRGAERVRVELVSE